MDPQQKPLKIDQKKPKIMRFYYFFIFLSMLIGFGFFVMSLMAFEFEESRIGMAKQGLTRTLVKILSFIGLFFLLSVFPGIYATQKRQNGYSNWICYCVILAMIWAFCVGACILAYVQMNDSQVLVEGLMVFLVDYDKTRPERRLDGYDEIQLKFKCCGVRDYKDWQEVDFGRTSLKVPKSCCLPARRSIEDCGQNLLPDHYNASAFIHPRGCAGPIQEQANQIIMSMTSFCAFSAVVLALVEALTLILISRKKL